MSRATERSTITAILKRIDHKVRFNQTLFHLSVASCLVLGALVLVEVAPRLVPVNMPPGSVILWAGSVAFLAFLLRAQIGVAANVLDAGAPDNPVSACGQGQVV